MEFDAALDQVGPDPDDTVDMVLPDDVDLDREPDDDEDEVVDLEPEPEPEEDQDV